MRWAVYLSLALGVSIGWGSWFQSVSQQSCLAVCEPHESACIAACQCALENCLLICSKDGAHKGCSQCTQKACSAPLDHLTTEIIGSKT